jgi:hypothetical protein
MIPIFSICPILIPLNCFFFFLVISIPYMVLLYQSKQDFMSTISVLSCTRIYGGFGISALILLGHEYYLCCMCDQFRSNVKLLLVLVFFLIMYLPKTRAKAGFTQRFSLCFINGLDQPYPLRTEIRQRQNSSRYYRLYESPLCITHSAKRDSEAVRCHVTPLRCKVGKWSFFHPLSCFPFRLSSLTSSLYIHIHTYNILRGAPPTFNQSINQNWGSSFLPCSL